jgi:hypothetical protein
MTELLFGSWGAPMATYSQQHPWLVFGALWVAVLTPLLFMKNNASSGGDVDLGWGDGDGADGGRGD